MAAGNALPGENGAPTRATIWLYYLYRWIIIAFGVALAAWSSSGIHYKDTATLALAAAAIGLLNVFIRPILVLFALPFVILTMGLGMLVINALLFMLAGALTPNFGVEGFWSALWAAVVVAVVGLVANTLVVSSNNSLRRNAGRRMGDSKKDDVIDI